MEGCENSGPYRNSIPATSSPQRVVIPIAPSQPTLSVTYSTPLILLCFLSARVFCKLYNIYVALRNAIALFSSHLIPIIDRSLGYSSM